MVASSWHWPEALRWRRRLRHWWLGRLPVCESWTLTQRNIYIMPTPAGWAFAATLLLLLIGSINYQLNLGYALTFLLAGSALASMHMTHASLRGLRLHVRPPAPTFCGEGVRLEVVLTNPSATRYGLSLGPATWDEVGELAWAEAPARAQTSVHLSLAAPQRGYQLLPFLHLESRFPFGLFRAWTVWRPLGGAWVYPRPEQPSPPLPAHPHNDQGGAQRRHVSGSEFEGVRPWRRGDSLRHIVWKKVARSGELVSRDTPATVQPQRWLDWQDTQLRDPEARLSRLAAWVLMCAAEERPFGLRLPGRELPCSSGPSQRQAALQALAEWQP